MVKLSPCVLSPDALVPVARACGVILHIRVQDVYVALTQAHHVRVLLEPRCVDWDTMSAMIAGPEVITIATGYRRIRPRRFGRCNSLSII